MSQLPPPYQPIPYGTPSPNRVPTAVMVLGIIGIIFGALIVLCGPFGIVMLFVDLGFPNPAMQAIKQSPALMTWTIVSQSVGWVVGVALLSGAIGSVMLKPWARRTMIVYAWTNIVLHVIGMVVNFAWVSPAMQQANARSGMTGAAAMGEMIGLVFSVLWLTFPVCILYFFTRPAVVEAFEGGAG